MTKVASICMSSDPRDKVLNRENMIKWIEKGAAEGVQLMVFPEEVLTGVGTTGMQQFNSEDKLVMQELSELVPEGESTQIFIELAKKYDMYIVWGIMGPKPGQCAATTGREEGWALADIDVEGDMNTARIFSMGGSDLLRDRKAGTYGELVQFNEYNPCWGGRGVFIDQEACE